MSGALHQFEELPWPDIEERVRRCDIVVLPLASLAPWPGSLPVGCDAFIVEGLVQRGAARIAEEVGALVLPALEFSTPAEPNLLPEAMHLPWDVLLDFTVSLLQDLHRQGFRRFVFVNAQGKTGSIPARAKPTEEEGGPRMAGEGFSYQTAFGFAYDAAAHFVENGPDVEFFFVSIASFFRNVAEIADLPWWEASGEGDLPMPVRWALLHALRSDLVAAQPPEPLSRALVPPYPFLADPRYGVGTILRHNRFQAAADAPDWEAISAEQTETLIEIWSEKFAAVLREMQAKAAWVGRYRPDAYRSGQP